MFPGTSQLGGVSYSSCMMGVSANTVSCLSVAERLRRRQLVNLCEHVFVQFLVTSAVLSVLVSGGQLVSAGLTGRKPPKNRLEI